MIEKINLWRLTNDARSPLFKEKGLALKGGSGFGEATITNFQ